MPIDQSVVGRVYHPQRYEVSREKIREFAEALGDGNPAYVDAQVGHRYGHTDVVAPPTFLTIPVMRGVSTLMDDLGVEFARVVHVDQRFTHARAVEAGDRLEAITSLDGLRHVAGNDLLKIRCEVRDDSGADVCTALSTVLVRPEDERVAG